MDKLKIIASIENQETIKKNPKSVKLIKMGMMDLNDES